MISTPQETTVTVIAGIASPLVEVHITYYADGECELKISFAGLEVVSTNPKNLDHALDTAKEEIRKVLLQMTPSINDNRNRTGADLHAVLRGDD